MLTLTLTTQLRLARQRARYIHRKITRNDLTAITQRALLREAARIAARITRLENLKGDK